MPSKFLDKGHPEGLYRFTKVPIEGPDGHTFLTINPVKRGKVVGPVLERFKDHTLETYTLKADKIGRVLMSKPLGGTGERFRGHECKFMEVSGVPMMVVAPKLDSKGISNAVSNMGGVSRRAQQPQAGQRKKTQRSPEGLMPKRGHVRIITPEKFKSLMAEIGPKPEKPPGGARWRLGKGGKIPTLPPKRKESAGKSGARRFRS